MKITSFFQPSATSPSAYILLLAEQRKEESCICEIFRRCQLALMLLSATSLGLIFWSLQTIAIWPAYKLGLAHLANLTSALALFIFAFTLPFGYVPKVDEKRSFWAEDTPGETEYMLIKREEIRFKAGSITGRPLRQRQAEKAFRQGSNYLPDQYFELGCDPNIYNTKGETPLLLAMRTSSTRKIASLINATNRNIEIERCDGCGFDALTYALSGISYDRFYRSYRFCKGEELLRGIRLVKIFINKYPALKLPGRETVTELSQTMERMASRGPEAEIYRLRNSENKLVRLFASAMSYSNDPDTWQKARRNIRVLLNHYDELLQFQLKLAAHPELKSAFAQAHNSTNDPRVIPEILAYL